MSIGTKSFIAFVVTTLVILAATAAVVRWNFKRGFMDYVNDLRRSRVEVLVERLGEHYGQDESWDFLGDNPQILRTLFSRSGQPGEGRPPNRHPREGHDGPPPRGRPPGDPMGFFRGLAVYDSNDNLIVGPARLKGELFEVTSDGKVVGYVRSAALRSLSPGVDLEFAQRQGRLFLWTLLGGLAFAALVAWFFARQLVRPIRTLTDGTQKLTAGDYGTRVTIDQQDELGRLGRDFNTLSAALELTASQRKALMADVSHELRTPLAVLRGQIAALRDGVREASDKTLGELDAQVGRLNDLVDELYDLSLADAGALSYEKRPIDLGALVRETLSAAIMRFQERGIAVEESFPTAPLVIFGDRRRLVQLFSNLIENSARYTDREGRVRVSCRAHQQRVIVDIEDSAPGVPDDALEKIFERLYRVEKSRSRESGGAGLGLALVEKIARAHDAVLRASHSDLGGVAMHLEFELYQKG